MKKLIVQHYPAANLPAHLRVHFLEAEYVVLTLECGDSDIEEVTVIDGSNMTGKWGAMDPSELHHRK